MSAVDDLNLNFDCDSVPASSLVSLRLPRGIFNETNSATELNVVFTLYESSTLFPDENNNPNMRVNTAVIGVDIEPINTDNLRENVTINFQLTTSVSALHC